MSYYALKRALREIELKVDLTQVETMKIADSAGNVINPATEETLTEIKTRTDKLTFDANDNLLVGINADAVGLAKESTLEGIKAQTDKLTFDGAGNLKVAVSGVVSSSSFSLPTVSQITIGKFCKRLIVVGVAQLDTSVDADFGVEVYNEALVLGRRFWIKYSATTREYSIVEAYLLNAQDKSTVVEYAFSSATQQRAVIEVAGGRWEVIARGEWVAHFVELHDMYVSYVKSIGTSLLKNETRVWYITM